MDVPITAIILQTAHGYYRHPVVPGVAVTSTATTITVATPQGKFTSPLDSDGFGVLGEMILGDPR